MTLTLELTPGLEAKAHQNAERNGMQLEVYLRQLLANAPLSPEKSLWDTLSPDEFNAALDEWIESHNQWSMLSDHAISRESIYGDNH